MGLRGGGGRAVRSLFLGTPFEVALNVSGLQYWGKSLDIS